MVKNLKLKNSSNFLQFPRNEHYQFKRQNDYQCTVVWGHLCCCDGIPQIPANSFPVLHLFLTGKITIFVFALLDHQHFGDESLGHTLFAEFLKPKNIKMSCYQSVHLTFLIKREFLV